MLHNIRNRAVRGIGVVTAKMLRHKRLSWHVIAVLEELGKVDYKIRVDGQDIRLLVSNGIEHYRAVSYADKEPETLRWISQYICQPDAVFYDIGANVGVYSLLAASLCTTGQRVLAFEPEALNFSRLNANIHHNSLGDHLMTYPIALSDNAGMDVLHISDCTAGAAFNSVGGEHMGRDVCRQQGTCLSTIDLLVTQHGFPAPTMIKIDVDGIEERIIDGAKAVLANPTLKTVLIEINSQTDVNYKTAFSDAGFVLVEQGKAEGTMCNHIYARESASEVT